MRDAWIRTCRVVVAVEALVGLAYDLPGLLATSLAAVAVFGLAHLLDR